MLALLLLIQEMFGPPMPRDLRPLAIVKLCPAPDSGGDIVVCGRADSGQRLGKLPERQSAGPVDPLSFRLPGGGRGDVHAVQSTLPGATGSGVVASFRIPFGKGKTP